MIDVQITLNDAETKTFLVNAKRKLDETEKPLATSMMYMVGSIKRNFLAQGRPIGWKPLSAYTLAMRRKGKGTGSAQILRDTGTLMNSINPGAIGSITKSGKTEAQVGTAIEYAGLMQYGGTGRIPARTIVPKKKKALRFMIGGKEVFARKVYQPEKVTQIPARKFLLFQDPEDIDRIQKIFSQHVNKAIEK